MGSIPDKVNVVFILSNPRGRTRPLGLTQSLTEKITRDFPWDKGRPERKADNLPPSISQLSRKYGCFDVVACRRGG
jgi:hypothetical protein